MADQNIGVLPRIDCLDPELMSAKKIVGELESEESLTGDPAPETRTRIDSGGGSAPHELRRKTARGALVSTVGQGASFFLRIGSMVVLARLLAPTDFGLVGMATACTGFLELFRDAGLSMATVQRVTITRAQISTLFWINLAVGATLAALCAAIAPFLTTFYHEPRLLWVTIVIGAGFVVSGAAAQHRALLMRDMRFALLTAIDIGSLFVSVALGIGMAAGGQGYWALVGMTVSLNVVSVLSLWVAGGWLPGRPQRGVGVRSMLKYGGTLTLNSVIVYIAYNADKVLLGRFWGADVLGIYGRAYQFINLPTSNLNTAIAQVAFPALSRLQDDPERLKSYFLKGYSLFLSLVLPITMACALFAEDIIRVFLGPKWGEAAPVFRLLAPTILAFAFINPFGWFMQATGRATRSLQIAFLLAPVVILGYLAGLRYGATGVAAGFSVATVVLVLPVIFWATRGTSITVMDTLRVVLRPFLSIMVGAGVALAAWPFIRLLSSPLLRLVAANGIMFCIYAVLLWFVMGQKAVYLGLLKDLGVWPLTGRRKQEESVEPGSNKKAVNK
jgi:O-antigen/teichoic acid export membrane protein